MSEVQPCCCPWVKMVYEASVLGLVGHFDARTAGGLSLSKRLITRLILSLSFSQNSSRTINCEFPGTNMWSIKKTKKKNLSQFYSSLFQIMFVVANMLNKIIYVSAVFLEASLHYFTFFAQPKKTPQSSEQNHCFMRPIRCREENKVSFNEKLLFAGRARKKKSEEEERILRPQATGGNQNIIKHFDLTPCCSWGLPLMQFGQDFSYKV